MRVSVKFIDIPTEKTTAVTDAILAIMSIAAAVYLPQIGQHQPWKANLWAWAFALLAAAAILGAVAHAIFLSKTVQKSLWYLLYLILGMLVALFLAGAAYDVWGLVAARKTLPAMLIIGLVFFCIIVFRPDRFSSFIIYEALAMTLALIGYLWLAVAGQLDGAWLMAAGILVTIIAAAVQAGKSVTFTFIWPFDHNGTYHLIQMAGVLLLVVGLSRSFLSFYPN